MCAFAPGYLHVDQAEPGLGGETAIVPPGNALNRAGFVAGNVTDFHPGNLAAATGSFFAAADPDATVISATNEQINRLARIAVGLVMDD